MIDEWWIPSQIAEQFVADCKDAAEDPVLFNSFRQMESITNVVDNKNSAGILGLWYFVKHFNPRLTEDADFLIALDEIGSPDLARITPELSLCPTTVATLADLSVLLTCFESLKGLRIVEIGGGYGSLAALITHFCDPASYVIYDLPEVCFLQKQFLTKMSIDSVRFCSDPEEVCESDLLLSDSALSELSASIRMKYAESLLVHADKGWLQWNSTRTRMSNIKAAAKWLRKVALKDDVRFGAELPYDHPEYLTQIVWGIGKYIPPTPEQTSD